MAIDMDKLHEFLGRFVTDLGAKAGGAAIQRVVTEAGFTRFRQAAETPFNLVYEVRP